MLLVCILLHDVSCGLRLRSAQKQTQPLKGFAGGYQIHCVALYGMMIRDIFMLTHDEGRSQWEQFGIHYVSRSDTHIHTAKALLESSMASIEILTRNL